MLEMLICDKNQWTRPQLLSNPQWYLDLLKDRIILEAQTNTSDNPEESNG